MLAQDFDLLTRFVEHAFDRIGNDLATDPLHRDRRQRVRDQHVSHEGIGLVADHDMPGLGNRLQARREVHLCALDCIVHPIDAAEVSDVAEAGVDSNPRTEGLLHAVVAPFHMQFGQAVLHLRGHSQAGLRVFGIAFGFRIAKENQDGVTDEFVDRAAMLERDVGHLGKIFVEQQRELLRLQSFGGCGKILNIGKEDRELLALYLLAYFMLVAVTGFTPSSPFSDARRRRSVV